MCERGWYAQCETTQVREQGKGAALFGYTRLYGSVPGGQAEYLRVPQAHFGPIKVPEGPPDERFLYLSDVLPTAWQAVEYAGIPDGGSVAIFGLGPIGQMSARIAHHRGYRVIGIDSVPERIEMARRYGVEVLNMKKHDNIPESIRELTEGRGPDSVIDAVGMEAHGAPGGKFAQQFAGMLPDKAARMLMEKAGVDRMSALLMAIYTVRRAGTISLSGVYGGQADPLPMMDLFDKGVQIRMGQANVKRWIDDDIMPLLTSDGDPLGVEDFATHRLPLEEAPHGYEIFQEKEDGAIKVLLKP
jgi:threonine dehydrogenase-like Zn-dependent dehydrogenase